MKDGLEKIMKSGLFDETSGRWIKILKGLTVFLFYALPVAGLITGILSWWWEESFGYFLLCLLLFAAGAFVQLVVNMLLINFLNNVQMIRERMSEKQTAVELPDQ